MYESLSNSPFFLPPTTTSALQNSSIASLFSTMNMNSSQFSNVSSSPFRLNLLSNSPLTRQKSFSSDFDESIEFRPSQHDGRSSPTQPDYKAREKTPDQPEIVWSQPDAAQTNALHIEYKTPTTIRTYITAEQERILEGLDGSPSPFKHARDVLKSLGARPPIRASSPVIEDLDLSQMLHDVLVKNGVIVESGHHVAVTDAEMVDILTNHLM